MNDERIELGPSLGGENTRYGLIAGRVGGEAVDGFSRHGDEPARADDADSFFYVFISYGAHTA